MVIERPEWIGEIRSALRRSRVVALVGPRQSGKTTLARRLVAPDSVSYFDLEDPLSLARLDEPMTALAPLRGTVVIDEIQRRPDLFQVLRVLADRRPLPARFLILGSAAPELLRQSSETLAGRIEVITLKGLSLGELGPGVVSKHWRRGGFPPAYLARSERASFVWREQFLRTYLERELPQLGLSVSSVTVQRFWGMLAHYHGGIWSGADAARALGSSEPTARRYLDLLTSMFMVRQLQPWHENTSKRQVKSPKVYLQDSGLLHALLGLDTERAVLSHPRCGASWEGYAIEEVLRAVRPDRAFFWATHGGAELDLLLFKGGRRFGVEVKRQDAPRITASIRIALQELGLERLTVLYPGEKAYTLDSRVRVMPLADLARGGGGALVERMGSRHRPRGN